MYFIHKQNIFHTFIQAMIWYLVEWVGVAWYLSIYTENVNDKYKYFYLFVRIGSEFFVTYFHKYISRKYKMYMNMELLTLFSIFFMFFRIAYKCVYIIDCRQFKKKIFYIPNIYLIVRGHHSIHKTQPYTCYTYV